MTRAMIFPGYGQERDPPIVATVSLTVLILEQRDELVCLITFKTSSIVEGRSSW